MLAYTATTWTQIIVAFSIFGPVAATAVIAWKVLHGGRNDPDEQRWTRLAEQRRQGGPDT